MSGELPDVLAAFEEIAPLGAVARFERGSLRSDGGHLQGVGVVDERTLAISTSASEGAAVAMIEWPERAGFGLGRVTRHVIVGRDPFLHAGGLQITDGILAVGVEDSEAHERSSTVFLDVADPAAPALLDHLGFDRPPRGEPRVEKRWTAGAVGLARHGDVYLLAVGSWDSAQIDFYVSNLGDLRDPACRFRPVAEWDSRSADRSDWIDRSYGSYQSLHVLVEATGATFVAAGNRNRIGEDWIDLFSVELSEETEPKVVKVAKRHLTCREGASFRWGGGFVTVDGVLHAIATGRDLEPSTTVNAFVGGGGARYVVNTRTGTIHSLLDPCPYVARMTPDHLLTTNDPTAGTERCGFCFPEPVDA